MTKVTPEIVRTMKGRHKIAALTAYDFPSAKLLDEIGVPVILVGDSVGMVVLGYPDTTRVTLADMEHHVRAAAQAHPRALLAADLPYRTYDTPRQAVENARRLIAAGAEAVKAEGGRIIIEQVRAIRSEGIPFIGHLGMLPQHVLEEGGYKIKGKTDSERQGFVVARGSDRNGTSACRNRGRRCGWASQCGGCHCDRRVRSPVRFARQATRTRRSDLHGRVSRTEPAARRQR